jgi:hypothetical protein
MLEHWRLVGASRTDMKQLTRQPILLAATLILGLAVATGCGKQPTSKAAVAPTQGVVGKVLQVRGKVTYSLEPGAVPKPLTPGMDLRAEWTVHTGSGAEVTARLSNGHRWTLAGDLSKRISKIRALTLAPVKEGAVAHLSNLGARSGKDRSAAAGLHQERTAGSKAAPTRAPLSDKEDDLDRVAPPTKKPADTRAPPPPPGTVGMVAPKREPRPRPVKSAPSRRRRHRSGRRPPKPSGGPVGLYARPRNVRGGAALGETPGTRGGSGTMSRPGSTETKGPATTKAGKTLPEKLTRAQVLPLLRRLRSRMTTCLKTHKVTTTLSVSLVIRGVDGRVMTVFVKGRSGSDKVVRCLKRRAQMIRFPKFSANRQTLRSIRLKAP